ncbi:hypothetical protein E4U53_007454 [Claviceps sorghi]|nr:hypothetical protein E4U53_007454 [Claviceps sorghi]
MNIQQSPDAGAASHEETATATATATASTPSTDVATENVAASDHTQEGETRPAEPAPKKTIIIKNVVIVNPATGTVQGNKTIKLSEGIITEIKDSDSSSPHDMSVHVVDRLAYHGFTLIVTRALLR